MTEQEVGFEVEDIKLDPKDLPFCDYDEFVPFERIESIMSCFENYKEINFKKIAECKNRIPINIANCLMHELNLSEIRLIRAKTFIINKIKKLKINYSCFQHRLEDWIVHSIKTENKFIYEQVQKIRECINEGTPQIEFHLNFFDPLTEYDLVDFDIGPKSINLPPEEEYTEDYFSYSQLYFILTDLANLKPKFVPNKQKMCQDLNFVVHHFGFRIKNNDIGQLSMFPDSWIDFSRSQIEKILGYVADHEKCVSLSDITLILTLWRYPTPTINEIESYRSNFEDYFASLNGTEDGKLDFDNFMKVACWLDEWDEGLCLGLSKETLYRTGYTKQFLFWAYNVDSDGQFDLDAYFETLKLFENKSRAVKLFRDSFVEENWF